MTSVPLDRPKVTKVRNLDDPQVRASLRREAERQARIAQRGKMSRVVEKRKS